MHGKLSGYKKVMITVNESIHNPVVLPFSFQRGNEETEGNENGNESSRDTSLLCRNENQVIWKMVLNQQIEEHCASDSAVV
jgi:hypothetical protein